MEEDEDFTLGDIGFELPDFATLGGVELSFVDDTDKARSNRYVKPKIDLFKSKRIIYENAEEMASKTDIRSCGRYDCVVGGNFVFGDFINAFLSVNNIRAESLVINTLSMNERNVYALEELVEKGYVGSLELVVSSYFYAHERGGTVKLIYDLLDTDDADFQMSVCSTHMKTVTILTSMGRKIVIHGSANMRSSGNIEQFTVELNDDLYDLYKGVTDVIREEYKTIDKEVRGERLIKSIRKGVDNG